jgi:hypothetical protein
VKFPTPSSMRCTVLSASLATALAPAHAVVLSGDGTGQALVFPYYTAQSAGSDAFNTYLSVVNHSPVAKALRVRFREGRAGRETLSFNLYLSANDVFTAAVVPFGSGTRLISVDHSCTDARFNVGTVPEAPFLDFRTDAFAGANDDGNGTGLDRTREGFVEVLEMAALGGASAAAVTHTSAGFPANCSAAIAAGDAQAPTGGLSGTLTLINVASGMDFTVNAEALEQLASRPYFRAASDPYPDFNANEIDAVSVVTANGSTWRSVWNRPVDAVSAVLMRRTLFGEYILDQPTASLTDFVVTFPTRHFYAGSATAASPFSQPLRWAPDCRGGGTLFGESFFDSAFNREEAVAPSPGDGPLLPPPPGDRLCATSTVLSIHNTALAQMPSSSSTSYVLGSVTRGFLASVVVPPGTLPVTANTAFQDGWITLGPSFDRSPAAAMSSRPESSRLTHGSGTSIPGSHAFNGLPMTGFSVRIFRNGTLRCGAGACQGNYGGAFPFTYRRDVQ